MVVTKKKLIVSKKFKEWLAGLIDGDGCFCLSKKGYASLEIIVEVRDKNCLFQIKDKFGGSIKLKTGCNWIRYRIHHREGIIHIVSAVNGLIRHPSRLVQLAKICNKYNILLSYALPLNYNNGWLSGFLDSDGSIYLNKVSGQIFITASQKNKLLLDPLVSLYGGVIYTLPKVNTFKWVVYRKMEVLNLVEYLKIYPLRSKKMVRIRLISKVYESFSHSGHKVNENTIYGKIWKYHYKRWILYGL